MRLWGSTADVLSGGRAWGAGRRGIDYEGEGGWGARRWGAREGKINRNKGRERGLFTCHAVLRWMKPSWASRSERGYSAGMGEGGGSVIIL